MRTRHAFLFTSLIAACGPSANVSTPAAPAPPATNGAAPQPREGAAETLTADTPRTTAAGTSFVAPAGWSLRQRGPATILEAPERDSWIALVDVEAKEADAAVAAAWAIYQPSASFPLKSATPRPDKDGWTDQRFYDYLTAPNDRREVFALAKRGGGQWTVVIYDASEPTGEKRIADVQTILGRLFPKGYERESFAGRKAHVLDQKRIAELGAFVERAQKTLQVPGVSLALVQDKKTIFAGGFGVREIGRPEKVGPKTLYIIASNTKALTTLLLAKLVDEKKLTWETPVKSLLPQFALGDPDTTNRVLVKHLVCACTGLPRQDFEWLFEFKNATPDSALATLAAMKPTSKFGEMFQYSNPLAAAGGWVAGHVAEPKLELGAAYDAAMKSRVFGPLGMNATTFDFKRALAADHATAHGIDVDGKTALATMDVNYSVVPVRPAGGAWSNVEDMAKYVTMELSNGLLPDGKRYVSESALFERRTRQVTVGQDVVYGMGLEVDTTYGVPLVHHGGDIIGYHSDMMWLPDHGVGAVVLTNGDYGSILVSRFRRKLLEVLFDGKPEADGEIEALGKAVHESIAAERKLLTIPADGAEVAKLGKVYKSPALGELRVVTAAGGTVFDFGEWKSPVATRKEPDGKVSFVTIATGVAGVPFVPTEQQGKRALVLRDAQHEYTFVAD